MTGEVVFGGPRLGAVRMLLPSDGKGRGDALGRSRCAASCAGVEEPLAVLVPYSKWYVVDAPGVAAVGAEYFEPAAGSGTKGPWMGDETLCISLLGAFSVTVNGDVIPDDAWRLRKAKTLIKLLALAPERRLHTELPWVH